MKTAVERIQEILLELNENQQMNVISECASKIGTEKWKEEVKELIRRMKELNR